CDGGKTRRLPTVRAGAGTPLAGRCLRGPGRWWGPVSMLTIARFTIQEPISRRLILAGAVLSLAFLGLFALGFYLIYQNSSDLSGPMSDAQEQAGFGTVMTVLGLYAVYFLAGFLALF